MGMGLQRKMCRCRGRKYKHRTEGVSGCRDTESPKVETAVCKRHRNSLCWRIFQLTLLCNAFCCHRCQLVFFSFPLPLLVAILQSRNGDAIAGKQWSSSCSTGLSVKPFLARICQAQV